jgi:hypothetical protein
MVEGINLDEQLTTYAAESSYTLSELKDAHETIVADLQSSLTDIYEQAVLRGDYPDRWVMEYRDKGVWLAYSHTEMFHRVREMDADIDMEVVELVLFASLDHMQHRDKYTLSVPGGLLRNRGSARADRDDPFYCPVFVPFPDQWKSGQRYTLHQFERLVSQYGLSPAEAMDYWVVDCQNVSPRSWAKLRGVTADAVRKNIRQAKEAFSEGGVDTKHDSITIEVAPLSEIPDDTPHDEDRDRFFTPVDPSNPPQGYTPSESTLENWPDEGE